MAAIHGTIYSVATVEADAVSSLQKALVLFTLSAADTYLQADDGDLLLVTTAIQNSRRNGKAVTLVDAMLDKPATKASDPSAILGLKTVAVSSTGLTFEVTDANFTSEYANSTLMVAQSRPFSVLVSFTEAG